LSGERGARSPRIGGRRGIVVVFGISGKVDPAEFGNP
jgi:hypothetical protein